MASFSSAKSVAAPVKSLCAGTQAFSDASHLASAKLESKFTKEDSFVIQVKRKLKHLDKSMKENELHDEASRLIDEDQLFCLFSHLVDLEGPAIEGVYDDLIKDELETSREFSAAKERQLIRHKQVAKLRLTVCLRPLKQFSGEASISQENKVVRIANFFDMEYSGYHAAILVDDVLLEWDDTSLVMPRRVDANDKFTFEGNVKESGEYFNKMMSGEAAFEDSLKPFEEEGKILCETAELKKKLIMKIIAIIVKYNKFYYYNSVARNCQKFVNDIIEAVQIKGSKFCEEDEKYLHQVRKGRVRIKSLSSYKTHADLDAYVSTFIESKEFDKLTEEELKIFMSRYQDFHGGQDCAEPSCKCSAVEKKISEL